MRSVCWFRNDLRVEDNPALYNACLTSKSVIGIFIVAQSQWKEHDDAKVKINFWFSRLILVILWNYGFPKAEPFYDVLVAVLLSILFILLKKK